MPEQPAINDVETRRNKLRRRWRWSPWRILPLPILAYIVTATYLWVIETPDALLRAIGPVLTVGTFVIVGPMIKRWWFVRERKKLNVPE